MDTEKHNIKEPRPRTLEEICETMPTHPYEKFEAIEITKDDGNRKILGPAIAPNWYKGGMIGRRVTYEETKTCNGIVTGQVSGYPDRATLERCPKKELPENQFIEALHANEPDFYFVEAALSRWRTALASERYESKRWNGLQWYECKPGYLAAMGGRQPLED